jgi:transposase
MTGLIDPMTRHSIVVLRKAGLTAKAVAEQASVSVRSVWRILNRQEGEIMGQGNGLVAARGVGRPSTVEEFRKQVETVLREEPRLKTVEILHRMRTAGYTGGKSALYELVTRLRVTSPTAPMVRFEGLAGEFSQHDFGHVDVHYEDGTRERVHFFVSRLKYSRWSRVTIVEDEKIESLVRTLLADFEAFGGIPLLAVFDNPKTVVLRHEGPRVEWNPTFAQVALDYGFGVELCTPGRGQEKGSVENLVGWVKGSFFKVRRFHDRQDMRVQLGAWHTEVNEQRPSRATGIVPLIRLAEEQKRFRPLAIPAAQYALRFPVVVGPTGMVEHKGYRYAMPPDSIGVPGTLFLGLNRVRIVAGRHEREHPRFPEQGAASYAPQDRARLLAAVSGARGRLYAKRQQILELGGSAETFLTELVHRRRFTWKGDVERIHDNLVQYGPQAVAWALEDACRQGMFAAEYVSLALRRYTEASAYASH